MFTNSKQLIKGRKYYFEVENVIVTYVTPNMAHTGRVGVADSNGNTFEVFVTSLKEVQDGVMEFVDAMCEMESTDCRSLNKKELARELMDMVCIPHDAIIHEIPLDWNRQVEICFEIPYNDQYYGLFAGIGTDKKFHFEINRTGIIREDESKKYFDFYEEEKLFRDYVKEWKL